MSSERPLLIGQPRRVLPVTDSTNDDAAAWARQGAPHGAVVLAEQQRRGRGRLGRAWSSLPGESLALSIVLRPALPPSAAPPVTLAVGLALLDTARSAGARAHLKWPNDLLVEEGAQRKKCAGVLTEMATSGMRIEHVIVGVGLNVNVETFPTELVEIATSLRRATGRVQDRAAILEQLLRSLEQRYTAFIDAGAAATVQAWKREVDFLGRAITVTAGDERVSGVAEDIDDDGALRLRTSDGACLRLWAGDVTVSEATA